MFLQILAYPAIRKNYQSPDCGPAVLGWDVCEALRGSAGPVRSPTPTALFALSGFWQEKNCADEKYRVILQFANHSIIVFIWGYNLSCEASGGKTNSWSTIVRRSHYLKTPTPTIFSNPLFGLINLELLLTLRIIIRLLLMNSVKIRKSFWQYV